MKGVAGISRPRRRHSSGEQRKLAPHTYLPVEIRPPPSEGTGR